MNTVRIDIPANHSNTNSYPDKWSPLSIRGLDMGATPLLLGFLSKEDRNDDGTYKRKLTHIVSKTPGHSWYYNQYHPMQYAGVSVDVFEIESYELDDDKWRFETQMPWSEELQKPKEKK